MKSTNIIIAAGLIILISSVLTGCSKLLEPREAAPAARQEAKPSAEEQQKRIRKLVQTAIAVKKEVGLVLEATKEGDVLTVDIKLDNSVQKPITSVQTWLSFDPTRLQGKDIDVSDSSFELVAPYENGFDNEQGLVMLGRASATKQFKKSLNVATVTFDIVGEGTLMIDTYDYRDDLTGHTSANSLIDDKPYNILIKPDSPALAVEN